ncbi:adenosylcobinamide kinase/adenosylcobinamide phosphate guanyltransferase [Wenxinia marina]|nr:bifunctional adenosylcobinamide kinase/adenosylcobinamide-phosphate guanylyltransferase [Wenxinia marina]GGL51539.1 adenosylcobinamide kinase/adenosylcobinamide phosphate guanyltransferase [Wenxinia marina]
MGLRKCTLVLGGAASGKSSFAETLVLQGGGTPVYVATAEAGDDEMLSKIARHRAQRASGGWRTIEEPLEIAGVLGGLADGEAALVDCATLWLGNLMGAGRDVEAETARLLDAIARCAAPVVVVSNEVGLGIVPDTPLGRRFREAQGALNQRIAAAADDVIFVAAGLPLVMKGALP